MILKNINRVLFILMAIICAIPASAQPPFEQTIGMDRERYDRLRPELVKLETCPVFPSFNVDSYCNDLSTVTQLRCSNWGEWNNTYKFLTHPNFPECPIRVDYATRRCLDDNNTFQIRVNAFMLLSFNTDCSGLLDYLREDGSPNQFEHDLYSIISRETFLKFNKQLMNAAPCCRDTLYCTDINGRPRENNFRISYIKGNCRACCYAQYKYTPFKPDILDTFEIIVYAMHPCQGFSCCEVRNQLCIDRITKEIIQREDTEPLTDASSNCTYTITNKDCLIHFPEEKEWSIIATGHTECRPSCSLKPMYIKDPAFKIK